MGNQTQESPRVSVTIVVYNGAQFIGEAIDSLLAQTFADFEVIVVDDGSTDETASILAAIDGPRLYVLSQNNQGIPRARNRALRHTRGGYVAVLDADDIAHPNRLAEQVAFLDAHPAVVAVGSAYRQVDMLRERTVDIVPPLEDVSIRRAMISGSPFCHSSVMMRRAALEQVGPYDEDFRFSQDYELWSRLAQAGELRNLPQVLVTRRYHTGSVSNNLRTEMLRLRLFWRASGRAAQRLGFPRHLRLLALRAMMLTLSVDIFAAAKYWWRTRLSS